MRFNLNEVATHTMSHLCLNKNCAKTNKKKTVERLKMKETGLAFTKNTKKNTYIGKQTQHRVNEVLVLRSFLSPWSVTFQCHVAIAFSFSISYLHVWIIRQSIKFSQSPLLLQEVMYCKITTK